MALKTHKFVVCQIYRSCIGHETFIRIMVLKTHKFVNFREVAFEYESFNRKWTINNKMILA